MPSQLKENGKRKYNHRIAIGYGKSFIILFVLSVFAAIAITIDKSIDIITFANLLEAQKKCMGIAPAVFLFAFLYVCINNENVVFEKDIGTLSLSFILSQCFWLGMKLDINGEIFHMTVSGIVHWVVITVGITFMLYVLIGFLFRQLENYDILGEYTLSDNGEAKRWALISLVWCLTSYLIYLALFFPGIVTKDSYWQINQALGFSPLSNHHPVLHTLVESLFLKPVYNLTGSIELGIGLFILFQLVVMSWIISYSQMVMTKMGIRKNIRIIILIFHSINPLFGMYSITMWKDIWMGMFIYLFLIFIIKIIYYNDESPWSLIRLYLSAIGVLFAKSTGIAMVGLMLVFMTVFLFKRNTRLSIKVAGVLAVSIFCFVAIQNIAINIYGVIPAPSRESKSVPLQQIARTVKEHGDELSKTEKDSINEILPFEELAEAYNPRLSDPVKDNFKSVAFEQNKGKYLKLWLELGKRFPDSYIKSFLYNTYGYWTPDVEYWVVTSSSYRDVLKRSIELGDEIYDDPDRYDMSDGFFAQRNNRLNQIISIRRLPGFSLLFSPGAYFWLYAILLIGAVKRNDKKYIVMNALPLAVFISCLISPLYCEMRYAYPAIIIMPLMFCLFAIHNNETDDNIIPNK